VKALLTSHQEFFYFLSVSIQFVLCLFPLNCPLCIVVGGGENCSLSQVWILTSSVYFLNTISTFSSGEPSLFRLCNKDAASLPTRQAFSIQIREWKDEQKPTRESSARKPQNKSMGEVVKSLRDHFYHTVKRLRKANKAQPKGTVNPHMKILTLFILSHVVPNLYDCLFSIESLKMTKTVIKALLTYS